MTSTRRDFVRQLTTAGLLLSAAPALQAGEASDARAEALAAAARVRARFAGLSEDPASLAADDAQWTDVARSWEVDRSIINLENGGVQPSPAVVNQAYMDAWRFGHAAPAHTMNRVLWPQVEGVRERLARAFGCDTEELALSRNTTEAVENVALGFPLQPGDEVLTTTQDYWRFLNTFRQRAEREKIVLRQVEIPVPLEDPAVAVQRVAEAITSRTRLLLISQAINLTGQFLPVRDIVRAAHARDVAVLVDGAHGFGHLPFSQADLECDFYATSLHKWLHAPHGTGFLYVRRDWISRIWPLFPAPAEQSGNIRKFESIGTVPAAPFVAINAALDYWESVGAERKAARLCWLRDYWLGRMTDLPGIRVLVTRLPGLAGALATVDFPGLPPTALAEHLWTKHRILVRPIRHPEFSGVRVTPSLYTTRDELDRFVEVLTQIRAHGLG
jgi:selenocysteine lyase/cysteine desulfurase